MKKAVDRNNKKSRKKKQNTKSLVVKPKELIHTTDDMPMAEPVNVAKHFFGTRASLSGSIIRTKEFDERFAYDGELGAFYTKAGTLLRLWAPTAQEVSVELWESLEEVASVNETISMVHRDTGVWELELPGDRNGTVYTYHLTFSDGTQHSTMDPYSKAVVANGEKTVILDPELVKVEDFKRMPPFSNPVDAVIYEMHVRDFSIDPDSGIKSKGKYSGVIETGTRNRKGSPTGLDYLKGLGITHVQLLPIFDYSTVDEYHPEKGYNWGYDPKNFNVPEGSYATDPRDPARRILELKEMIRGLHRAGIRVIMDVVYNHVYEVSMHSLHKTAPGYFFRYDKKGILANGTGVGNDTASERHMMRKYMIDSIRYWLEEFKLDGFRFDLMGIHDVETMRKIRTTADSIDPSIMILGEGWNLDTTLFESERAWQGNAHRMPRIAHFNDTIRDAAMGSVLRGKNKAFVSGRHRVGERLAQSLSGKPWPKSHATYKTPEQMIQYVEAHDNLTVYDKLRLMDHKDPETTRIRRHTLATSLVLLAQGVPFIHGGQEFLRTKQGDENSYMSGDVVNRFDWTRQDTYRNAVDYFKGLVALRKNHQLFRQRDLASISEKLQVLHNNGGIIVISLQDETEELLVVFNGNNRKRRVRIPKGRWEILVHDMKVLKVPAAIKLRTGLTRVEPVSVLILKKAPERSL